EAERLRPSGESPSAVRGLVGVAHREAAARQHSKTKAALRASYAKDECCRRGAWCVSRARSAGRLTGSATECRRYTRKTNLRLPVHRPCKPGGVPQRRSSQGQHPPKQKAPPATARQLRSIRPVASPGAHCVVLSATPKKSPCDREPSGSDPLRGAAGKLRGRGSEAPLGQAHRPRREAIRSRLHQRF